MSKLLRTIALSADTTTASRISHARRLPVHLVNASIPRLMFRSDCKDGPPQLFFCCLGCTARVQWPIRPGSHEATAPFQRAKPPSIGSLSRVKPPLAAALPPYGPLVLAACDAHMAADAGPIMPAVRHEVVALRFQPDGAGDGVPEQFTVAGGAARAA